MTHPRYPYSIVKEQSFRPSSRGRAAHFRRGNTFPEGAGRCKRLLVWTLGSGSIPGFMGILTVLSQLCDNMK